MTRTIDPEMRELIKSVMVEALDAHTLQEQRSLSISEFCVAEGMSRTTYFKLQRLGKGPQELRVEGTNFTRITPESRRKWRADREGESKSEESRKEAERRKAHAKILGKRAAKSELHISNRRKK